MPAEMTPVKNRLSGLRATLREGNSTLIMQNNVTDKLYIRLNKEEIVVDTNVFLGILNNLLKTEVSK